jgi:DNA-binding transcriptional ArsR family regulator
VILDLAKINLIIHPVRFRILQTLAVEPLTTQEIAEKLPSVPKSSIYRHLKVLLEGKVVGVAEARLVKGIQERTYQLVQRPYLGPDDMSGLTPDEHLDYFAIYLMTVLQGFADYLADAAEKGDQIDLLADRVGYTEAIFFANRDELELFQRRVNQALAELVGNQGGEDRQRHKIALITHPVQ